MGYSWYRVDGAAADHPKVMELAARLGDAEIALADGYVMRLWSWAQRYAPDGAFSARVVPQLERYLGREGVIRLMVDVGLVDADDDEFAVHDWEQMQGALVEKSSRDAKMKRVKRRANGARPAPTKTKPGAQPAPATDETDGRNVRDERTDETGVPDGPASALGLAWNASTTPPLPRVTLPLSKTREAAAVAALARRPIEAWRQVFVRINASSFLRGGDGGWKADFDWAVRPEGTKPEPATKVLEGAYDRAGPSPPARERDVSTAPRPEGYVTL